MAATKNGFLLGIGNPLLDISAEVPASMLEKYGLAPASAILAEERHLPLYPELEKDYAVQYIAGGATQNSIRGAQWMLKGAGAAFAGATTYIGCVGEDAYAAKLAEAARADGVEVAYMRTAEAPTGTCAVLVVAHERSMVANLGAANKYALAHLEANWALVTRAAFYYSAGFFLTVCPEAVLKIGAHAAAENKLLAINLAAPFIVQFFWDGKLEEVLRYADIVFGNDDEARALGKARGWGEDVDAIARRLAEFPKANARRARRVVITTGPMPVHVHTAASDAAPASVEQFAVPPVPEAEIVDTNGAGDAFVAGYLSQLVQDKPLAVCVAAANYCASRIIRTSGSVFTGEPSFSS